MQGLRLYKIEKLCSLTAIEYLFSPAVKSAGGNNAIMAYPWRAVWRERDAGDRRPPVTQFMITVPKRRLRHAVDRVTQRRRLREAYRLNRSLLPDGKPVDIAFVYVGNGLTSYADAERSIRKIFSRISEHLSQS